MGHRKEITGKLLLHLYMCKIGQKGSQVEVGVCFRQMLPIFRQNVSFRPENTFRKLGPMFGPGHHLSKRRRWKELPHNRATTWLLLQLRQSGLPRGFLPTIAGVVLPVDLS